ncbi:hypothetical protein [Bradyrhizobium sp. USDA 4473]
MDTIASDADDLVQLVGGLGRAVRQQSLNPVACIWARKEDGAPNRSVSHVSDLDGNSVFYRQLADEVLIQVKKARRASGTTDGDAPPRVLRMGKHVRSRVIRPAALQSDKPESS